MSTAEKSDTEEWDEFSAEKSSLHRDLQGSHLSELTLLDDFFQADDLVLLSVYGNRIKAASRGAYSVLGWKASELLSVPADTLFHAEDAPITLRGITQVGYALRQMWPARFRHKAGLWRLMLWSVSVPKHDPNLILAVGVDLSNDPDLWNLLRTRQRVK